ncbi:MAG: hypothetical protein KDC24_06770 [Saprospiraceae bacterium]|nr:hypothetical protein [Saprospiraceae bacterium]
MNKTLQLFALLGIFIFSACQSHETDTGLLGDWQGIKWIVEGNDSGRDVSVVTFSFQQDGTYNANYGQQAESGTYYTKEGKLYTHADGQVEKMVQYSYQGTDTIKMVMNRAGTAEDLYLVKK